MDEGVGELSMGAESNPLPPLRWDLSALEKRNQDELRHQNDDEK
jgi:hypothetical protein